MDFFLTRFFVAVCAFGLAAISTGTAAQTISIQITPLGNATLTWNASATGPVNVERSQNLSGWSVVAEGNTSGVFTESSAGLSKAFYRLGKMVFVGGNASANIPDLLVSNTETTWGEWKRVRAWAVANGYDLANIGAAAGDNERQPVQSVNWYDVLKWCNARSEMEGLTPVYTVNEDTYKSGQIVPRADFSASGYRLPSEAEWAWAAGGGVRSQGYKYSGSATIDSVAWYDLNSGGGPKPVGTKSANELALFDMSGNVFEWCGDAATSDTFDLVAANRGGSWEVDELRCEILFASEEFANARSTDIGFRVVRNHVDGFQ